MEGVDVGSTLWYLGLSGKHCRQPLSIPIQETVSGFNYPLTSTIIFMIFTMLNLMNSLGY